MSKGIPKKVIDISGIELMPGEPTVCLGNGKQDFECCCVNATIIYFVFLNLSSKGDRIDKTKILHILL